MTRMLASGAVAAVAVLPAAGAAQQPVTGPDPVTRLEPGAFGKVPAPVVEQLDAMGCDIPQAYGEAEPHNVVRGQFADPGQTDWAALCSRDGASHIVVLWGGPARCPALPERLDDDSFLVRAFDAERPVFARGLGTVTPATLDPRFWVYEGAGAPPEPTHDALADAFYQKGAVAYYCHEGRWLRFVSD